jgi:phosphoenolpyruvate carboxykinase (ATP)
VHTRAIIGAALRNELNVVPMRMMSNLNLEIPVHCPGVPDELLNPKDTWKDKAAFVLTLQMLVSKFDSNFKKFSQSLPESISQAGPRFRE